MALAIILLLGIAITFVIILKPLYGLYIILSVSPFFLISSLVGQGNFLGRTILPTDIMLAIVLIGYLLIICLRPKRAIIPNCPSFLWVITIIVLGLGQGFLYHYKGAFAIGRGFMMYSLLFPCYYLLIKLKARTKLLKFLLYLFLIQNSIIIYSAIRGLGPYMGNLMETGLYRATVVESGISLTAFFLSLAYLSYSKFKSLKLCLLPCLTLITSILVLILSFRRSLVCGMIIGLCIFLIINKIITKKNNILSKTKFYITISTLILTIPSIYFIFKNNIWNIFWSRIVHTSLMETSISARLIEMKCSFLSFLQSPIFGHGFDHPILLANANFQWWGKFAWGHNDYLVILDTMGIIGVVAFFAFIYSGIRSSWHVIKKSNNNTDKIFSITLLSTMAAFLTGAFFTLIFRNIALVPLIVVLYGAVFGAISPSNNKK